jgi:hypothetical protein
VTQRGKTAGNPQGNWLPHRTIFALKVKIEAEMSLRNGNIDMSIANTRIYQEREELGCTIKQLATENAKLRQELAYREEKIEGRRTNCSEIQHQV